MKAVIQRVSSAKVHGKDWNANRKNIIVLNYFILVNEELISSIGRGLCILVGIHQEDTQKDVDYL